jgi:hypothetical protein
MPKLQCINDNTKTYNGTENTPLGLGYSAQGCKLGEIKIGKDNLKYIVIQTKDIKKWSKYTEKKNNKKEETVEKRDEIIIEKHDEKEEKIEDSTEKEEIIVEKEEYIIEKEQMIVEKEEERILEKEDIVEKEEILKEDIIEKEEERIVEKEERIIEKEEILKEYIVEKEEILKEDIVEKEEILKEDIIEKEEEKILEKENSTEEEILVEKDINTTIENKKDNLDNLGTNYFRSCYIPNFEKKEKDENGLEEKIGGKLPFFIKDETWPLDKNLNPMIFLCQYKDRKNTKKMIRIFYSLNNDVNVSFIELSKENISKQIYIEQPIYNEPTFILSWNIDIELISYEELKKTKNISFENYKEHPMYPSDQIKIGGTCINHKISKPNFIQLTSHFIKICNIYEYDENEYKMELL